MSATNPGPATSNAAPSEALAAGRISQRAAARLKDRGAFRLKLWASYLCALLVLGVGIASVIQNHETEAAAARATSLQLVVRQLLDTELALLNAETAQRGYLLTSNERYRKPYDMAAGQIEPNLARLSDLVHDDPVQFRNAQALRGLVRRKLEELAVTQRVHDAGGDALAIVKQNTGQLLMEQIRAQVEVMAEHARAARDAQEHKAAALRAFAQGSVALGNAVAFALAAAITFWIGTAFRDSHAAQVELERHAVQLGDTARRLEQQEQALATRLNAEQRLRSRLERTNAALQKSNADLQFFSYMASHDLRAPLRGISNVSDWIEQDFGEIAPPEVKQHMQTMRGRVHRLEGLIDAIAAYAKAGQRPEAAEAIDLEELLRDVSEGLPKPANASIAWQSPLPKLHTVRQPLQQILTNLLGNALKHGSRTGGQVTLELRDTGAFWEFTIRDRGPGIPPEYHAKIFGLFQTLAARDHVEGAGMGLAIVKKLVDQYGGEISVASSPGQGASFTVKWPKDIGTPE